MSIAEKSVSKMKQPTSSTRAVSSTVDESKQPVTKTAAPKSGTAVHVAHSQSDPVLPRRDDGALITNIAEDSVRFLLSGIVWVWFFCLKFMLVPLHLITRNEIAMLVCAK